MPGQAVKSFVKFWQTALANDLAEQLLLAKIMPTGVKFKQAAAHIKALQFAPHRGIGQQQVTANAGQNPGEFLHIFLAVGAVYAQRVQLHQLPGQVFVDTTGSILFVVEVAQHGWVPGRGTQQIAEPAQRVRSDGAVFVVAEHRSDIGLVLEHAEVVEPKPAHLLVELVGRVHGTQNMPAGGFPGQAVEFLLIGLLGSFFVLVVFKGVVFAALLLKRLHHRHKRFLADAQRLHLAGHRSWQFGPAGFELCCEQGGQPQASRLGHR